MRHAEAARIASDIGKRLTCWRRRRASPPIIQAATDAADGHHRAHRDVDAARGDHQRHAQRHQHQRRRAVQDVDQAAVQVAVAPFQCRKLPLNAALTPAAAAA
jgi:hypothetical protein